MAGMESYPRYSYEHESILDRSVRSRYGSDVLRFPEGGSGERVSPKSFEDVTQEDDGESSDSSRRFSYVYAFSYRLIW
jgi:hypothetical protein